MREEALVLCSVGGADITAYGAMMALAALLGTLLTVLLGRKRVGVGAAASLSLSAIIGAVLGGHIVYILTNLGTVLADYESGISMLWRFQLGGYTLYGAVLGGMAGIALDALLTKKSVLKLTDIAAPGAMLALCVGRVAEMFTDQGLGDWLDEEAEELLRFPFAVAVDLGDDYVEWRMPVFAYEAAIALVLCVAAIVLLCRAKREGRLTGTMLTLLGTTQIFMEQIRQDDYIRFGFVRFTQVAAILLVLAVLVLRVIRSAKAAHWKPALTLRCCIFVLSAFLVILVEFAVEKPQYLPVLRVCLLVWAALIAAWLVDGAAMAFKAEGSRKDLVLVSIVSLIVVAASVTTVVLLTKSLEWENTLLLGVMAAALVAAACVVQIRTDEDRDAV